MEMAQYVAEDLVFLDESIFNEKTGWRHRAYGPIGSALRYSADLRRGRTWSILAAITIAGYVQCTGVKEDYFKTSDVLNWLRTALLPALRRESGRPRVTVLDNNSTHIDRVIVEAIEAAGHVIQFLPPYSPGHNPIELSFSVLKAWLQRNYVWTSHSYGNFGSYLIFAIRASRCDRFAREQFRHAAGGLYMEAEELERFRGWLRNWERGAGAEVLVEEIEVPEEDLAVAMEGAEQVGEGGNEVGEDAGDEGSEGREVMSLGDVPGA